MSTLLLAWGNPGRLDDGLGPAFADVAKGWRLPGLVVDSDYHLQVEDAERVAERSRVIFVDADRSCAEPFRVQRIRAGRTGICFSSHIVTPQSVLALSRDLFHAEPEAWLIGIRGYEFDEFGERLSRGGRVNLEAAAEFLRTAIDGGELSEIRPVESEVTHAG